MQEKNDPLVMLAFVVLFATLWLCFHFLEKRGAWGLLARHFPTERKVKIADAGILSCAEHTIRFARNGKWDNGIYEGRYILPTPEGVFFATPWVSKLLGLSSNFFIPWEAMVVTLEDERFLGMKRSQHYIHIWANGEKITFYLHPSILDAGKQHGLIVPNEITV